MKHTMLTRGASGVMALSFAATMVTPAFASEVTLKKGTEVHLIFDTPLSSKTSRPGDWVRFHVEEPVMVDNTTVIASGAKVTGQIHKIDKRGRYGKNAKVELDMMPVRAVNGTKIMLEPKTRGMLASSKTGDAAAATAGGAILLGPIGLIGGAFIVGKSVNAKPGDKATVQTSRDANLNIK